MTDGVTPDSVPLRDEPRGDVLIFQLVNFRDRSKYFWLRVFRLPILKPQKNLSRQPFQSATLSDVSSLLLIPPARLTQSNKEIP